MNSDMVIVRDGTAYRLLHGHLRLANMLHASDETSVDVAGEGKVKVMKTRSGYLVDKGGHRLPLHRN